MRCFGWVGILCVLSACGVDEDSLSSDLLGSRVDVGSVVDGGLVEHTDLGPGVEIVTDGPHISLSYPLDSWGPYSVGHRSWEHRYTPPWEGAAERTIMIDLWYPTEDSSGSPAQMADGLLEDELAFEDASVAPPPDPRGFPVHVYSHGDRGFGGDNYITLRRIASHGWVTIAPTHSGNTLADNIDPSPPEHWLHRPLDVSAALDALAGLDAQDPMAGLPMLDKVLMSGHSRGGTTVWALSGADYDLARLESDYTLTPELRAAFEDGARDERVVATVVLAGGLRESVFGEDGWQSVVVPMLHMTGSEDDRGMAALWARMSGLPMIWIDILGGCHLSFNLGLCGTLDGELGLSIIGTWTLAFGRHHLLGDDGEATKALLDGVAEGQELVTYQRMSP